MVLLHFLENRTNLKIPSEITQSLKYDSGDDSGPNRVQIFATNADIQRLIASPRIYGDGSFKRPLKKLFAQYWTLHGEVSQNPLIVKPLLYMLFPNKTTELYRSALRALQDHVCEVSWQ